MVKLATTAFSLLLSFAAFIPAAAQKRGHQSGATSAKPALKFLDAIQVNTVDMAPVQTAGATVPELFKEVPPVLLIPTFHTADANAIESVNSLQLKYAVLLDTEVERLQNTTLFSIIDEWHGTRYVLGGSTKAGIDCSAFVQAVYAKLFQRPMPRTVREQHKAVAEIPRAEIMQGDLVFFKTRGSSVSHVGIYLQNNKFVHAASSGGVMVSDLFDDYWMRRFAGVGRMENSTEAQALPIHP